MRRWIGALLVAAMCMSLLTFGWAEEPKTEEPAAPEHEHTWVLTANTATCLQDGEKTYICALCNEIKTETAAAQGHKLSEAWSSDETSHWHVCELCGERFDTAEHTCVEGAAWSSDGTNHWRECAVCKAHCKAAAHAWDSGKVTASPTCVKNGEKVYTCKTCGAVKKQTLEMTEHSWDGGKTTKEATITEPGESTYKCVVCGKETVREIPPLGESMTPEELTTMQAAPDNVLQARLNDETWVVLQAVLDAEEMERVRGGWPVTVTLTAEDAADALDNQTEKSIADTVGEKKICTAFRLTLEKELQDDPAVAVDTAAEPVIIALTPPDDLKHRGAHVTREYTVYFLENGQARKMATQFDEENGLILFQTDSFGTYVLAYRDIREGNAGSWVLALYILLGLLTLGGIGVLVKKLFFGQDEEESASEEAYEQTFTEEESVPRRSWAEWLTEWMEALRGRRHERSDRENRRRYHDEDE